MGFGKTYMLDMYDCEVGACDNLELHYRFLEELTATLGMTPMSRPIVIHGPTKFVGDDRIEEFPDKAGVSAWQPLIESGIQVHSVEPSKFSTIDVYTCGQLNPQKVYDVAKKYFKFKDYEEYLISRGNRYS